MDITWIEALIPVVVPLLVEATLRIIRNLPKWTVPVLIAPLLGALIQALDALLAGGGFAPIVGMLLGGLGVWLREVVAQISRGVQAGANGRPAPRIER